MKFKSVATDSKWKSKLCISEAKVARLGFIIVRDRALSPDQCLEILLLSLTTFIRSPPVAIGGERIKVVSDRVNHFKRSNLERAYHRGD